MTAVDDRTPWRRFERILDDGTAEHYEVRRKGIRCFLRWGSTTRKGKGTTVVLDDEAAARRHVDRKIADRLRKGFTEVTWPAEAPTPADALVVPTLLAHETKSWYTPPPYEPVAGLPDVVGRSLLGADNHGFYWYLVLRDGGRFAIAVNVTRASHRPDDAHAFLAFVAAHRDLPFDGRSHHKVALPAAIGPFTHALFCWPALGGQANHPGLEDRVGLAFPLFECEIGDAEPEVFVDARIRGRTALNWANWSRAPEPAIDACGAIPGVITTRVFKTLDAASIPRVLAALGTAAPDSWLQVRRFRGDAVRLEPTDVGPDTAAQIAAFVVGDLPDGLRARLL